MRILIDENLPIAFFSELLAEFETTTISDLGWAGISNGDLLRRIEGNFDLFVTGDKNLQFQQNIADRTYAIVEVYTNRLSLLTEIEARVLSEIRSVTGNRYITIGP